MHWLYYDCQSISSFDPHVPNCSLNHLKKLLMKPHTATTVVKPNRIE
jgi:hypothetical protein